MIHDDIPGGVGCITHGTQLVFDAHIFDGLLTEDAPARPQGYESV